MIVSGTGHRPDKLGGYSSRAEIELQRIAEAWLLDHLPAKVISGMALGWDTALAKAALKLNIPLIAAVPFYGQEKRWPKKSQDAFLEILGSTEEVIIVSEGGFSAAKMQTRNEWMVDNSTVILAMWDGSPGGTKNCIDYAEAKGATVENLFAEFQKLNI